MTDASDSDTGPLALGAGWTETRFDRDASGASEDITIRAAFTHDSMRIRIEPVRYERSGHREDIEPLHDDGDEVSRRLPPYLETDQPPVTAFATIVGYRPGERERRTVFTVTRDPDDALAAGLWLTANTDTDWEMERNMRLHRGQPTARTDVVVSDDDALGALFRDAPDRCVFSGKPTRSHQIRLPFRYVAVLTQRKHTPRGVLRVPSTVDSLVGAASHEAWTDRDLGDIDWTAPVTRSGPGKFALAEQVREVVAGLDAAAFTCLWLGETVDSR